jgi:hypothetical protein
MAAPTVRRAYNNMALFKVTMNVNADDVETLDVYHAHFINQFNAWFLVWRGGKFEYVEARKCKLLNGPA